MLFCEKYLKDNNTIASIPHLFRVRYKLLSRTAASNRAENDFGAQPVKLTKTLQAAVKSGYYRYMIHLVAVYVSHDELRQLYGRPKKLIRDTFLIIIATDLTFVWSVEASSTKFNCFALHTSEIGDWFMTNLGGVLFSRAQFISQAGKQYLHLSNSFVHYDRLAIQGNLRGTQLEPKSSSNHVLWLYQSVWLTEQLTTDFAVFVAKFAWTAEIAQNTRKAVKLSDRFWFTLAVFSVENV